MEAERVKRWTELVSKWACVPPVTPRMAEILAGGPRPDDGGNAAVPSCRIVRFDTISSFELNPELHAALKAVPEAELWAELRLSLFSQNGNQFFGNTWVGEQHEPVFKGTGSAMIEVEFDERVVFQTRADHRSGCIGVLEVVTGVSRPSGAQLLPAVTVGWAPIPIFAELPSPRATDDHGTDPDEFPLKAVRLLKGSPRLLLTLDMAVVADILHPFSEQTPTSIIVEYRLGACPELQHFAHLIPENAVVGEGELVPGLLNEEEQDATLPDDLYEDGRLAPTRTVHLDNLRLRASDGWEAFERRVIAAWLDSDPAVSEGEVATITDRRVSVGIHNGRRYLAPPSVIHLSPAGADPNILEFRGAPAVPHVPVNELCAVVLELQMAIAGSAPDALHGTMRNHTAVITARWLPLFPFATGVPTTREQTSQMLSGPGRTPSRKLILSQPESGVDVVELTVDISSTRDTDSELTVKRLGIASPDGLGSTGGGRAAAADARPALASPLPGEVATLRRRDTARQSTYTAQLEPTELSVQRSERVDQRATAKLVVPRDWTALSRASEAALLRIEFPRHIQSSSVMASSPRPSTGRLNLDAELADLRQTNEVGILFEGLALQHAAAGDFAGRLPGRVRFAFRFYHCGASSTPPLGLAQVPGDASQGADPLRVLVRSDGKPGMLMTFVVEPVFGRVVERQRFVRYLESGHLQIDVWDADSELLFATGSFPLFHFLRGGAAAVESQVEVPVYHESAMWLPHSAPSLAGIAMVPANEKAVAGRRVGSLFCRLSSVGKVTRPGSATGELAHATVVRPPDRTELAATLADRNAVTIVKRVSETHGKAGTMTAPLPTARGSKDMSESERKKYRLEAIRRSRSGQEAPHPRPSLSQTLPTVDLEKVHTLRHESKHTRITGLLHAAITAKKVIRPKFGCPIYFEYALSNPTAEVAHVCVQHDCSDLRVIHDADEWAFYKVASGLPGKVERHMFLIEDGRHEVIVHPGEEVSVPLLYVCYRALDPARSRSPGSKTPDGAALENGRLCGKAEELSSLDVMVKFVTVKHNQVLGVLDLHVEPQPFAVDKRYHFWQPDGVALNQAVPLPATLSLDGAGSRISEISVRTSSPRATLELRSTKSHKQQEEVNVRLQRPAKGTTSFFAAFYTDIYCSAPVEIWELTVYAVDVIECTVPQGATKRLALNVMSDYRSRRVATYSSSPSEVFGAASDPVVVTAAALTPITASVATTAVGKKQVLVSVADVEDGTQLCSFLVVVTSIPSDPTKEWQLTIDAGRRVAKRLTHVNPYDERHAFSFATDRSDLLEIVPQTIAIDKQAHVLFRFQAMSAGTHFRTKVFVTNEDGAIEAVYGLFVQVQHRAIESKPTRAARFEGASTNLRALDTLPMAAALETPRQSRSGVR